MADEKQQTEQKFSLVGFDNFVRHNPMSDKFDADDFHHLEFWCADATNVSGRFIWGMGMTKVAKSDMSTGNKTCASYVLQSNDTKFVFTAPYSCDIDSPGNLGVPGYTRESAHAFVQEHGLAVRAVGLKVGDATAAYEAAIANGAIGVLEPQTVASDGDSATIAEVKLYGDAVLRFLSYDDSYTKPFLPTYVSVDSPPVSYGITRIDHVVGNVPKLLPAVEYIGKITGFHEFAEFVAEDVGTLDSGLNSMVMANNSERILMPVNEPTHGTRRKSQIQTYLEQNRGAGVQHIAVKTDDIFLTMRELRKRTHLGGFDFMPRASEKYYRNLPNHVPGLTLEQYEQIEELGLLADRDEKGTLLQVFTKPLGDRATAFIEIIQRIGCMATDPEDETKQLQAPACGGFGKGNFKELFKSIEDYERSLDLGNVEVSVDASETNEAE